MAKLSSTNIYGNLNTSDEIYAQGDKKVYHTGNKPTSADITDATNANTANKIVKRDGSGNFSAGTITASLSGNASTATKLQTTRSINGTNFDGSAAITTANWGTARNLTIGNTAKSVNGSANVAWTLAEIGAAAASHTHNKLMSRSSTRLTTANTATVVGPSMDMFLSTSNMTTGKPHTDGYITEYHWDNSGGWSSQLFIPNNGAAGKMQFRAMSNGTWEDWNTVYSTNNKPSPADIGAATSGHTHNYAGSTSAGGNANAAVKLATARTLTIGSSGKSFDGSGNVSWSLSEIGAAAASHGIHMPSTCTTITDWNSATTTGWYMASGASNAPEASQWFFGEVITHNTNYVYQTVYKFTASTDAKAITKYIRAKMNGTWGAWTNVTVAIAVPATAKFTDTVYTHPTTTGNKHIPSGGASGQILRWSADGTAAWGSDTNTWRGIQDNLTSTSTTDSLSANQGKVLKGLVDGKAASSHTHSSLLGLTGSTVAPSTGTGVLRYDYAVPSSTTGVMPSTNNANGLLTLNTHSGNYYSQLGFSSNGNIYYRNFNSVALDSTTGWKTIAFTNSSISGNAATATKLQTTRSINGTNFDGSAAITTANWGTARSISSTGDVSWSVSTNGSANVSATATLANSGVTAGSYGPTGNATLAFGGTFTVPYATVDAKGRVTGAATRTFTMPTLTVSDTKVTNTLATTTKAYVTGTTTATTNTGTQVFDTGVYLDTTAGKLVASNFTGTLTGNASSATKLATARAINGTNFDGTAAITTANWGTARSITIGNTSKSVNGSANVSWTLGEIGAATSGHNHENLYFNKVKGTVTDFNTVLTEGQYSFSSGSSITNAPKTGRLYGTLIVYVNDGGTHNNSTNWIWQIAYCTDKTTWRREKLNGDAWKPWARMYDSESKPSASDIAGGTLDGYLGVTGNSDINGNLGIGGQLYIKVNGSATSVNTEIANLKSSVSSGKSAVATAITGKGVSTSATADFSTMATNIGKLPGKGTIVSLSNANIALEGISQADSTKINGHSFDDVLHDDDYYTVGARDYYEVGRVHCGLASMIWWSSSYGYISSSSHVNSTLCYYGYNSKVTVVDSDGGALYTISLTGMGTLGSTGVAVEIMAGYMVVVSRNSGGTNCYISLFRNGTLLWRNTFADSSGTISAVMTKRSIRLIRGIIYVVLYGVDGTGHRLYTFTMSGTSYLISTQPASAFYYPTISGYDNAVYILGGAKAYTYDHKLIWSDEKATSSSTRFQEYETLSSGIRLGAVGKQTQIRGLSNEILYSGYIGHNTGASVNSLSLSRDGQHVISSHYYRKQTVSKHKLAYALK